MLKNGARGEERGYEQSVAARMSFIAYGQTSLGEVGLE